MDPSVTGAFRKLHFDIECEQAIEQCSLAIKMLRAELVALTLLATVFQQPKPQQWSQDSASMA